MMIHSYAPLEATPTTAADAKPADSRNHHHHHRLTVDTTVSATAVPPVSSSSSRRQQRMARPASMRALVGRSASDSSARHGAPRSLDAGSAIATTSSHNNNSSNNNNELGDVTLLTMSTPPALRGKRMRRFKSYSESGALLERIVPPVRTRPYSAGDVEDMRRRVTISGVSKNSKGTWMFKVDVGSDEWNTYVIRRRFTDFKELHDGLQEYEEWEALPALPHHGLYSVFQLFVSPEKALNQRAERLQVLLQRISTHPVLSAAAAFKKFIGKNPQSLELGYVSLSCYEAPTSENQLRLSASESSFVYERRLSD